MKPPIGAFAPTVTQHVLNGTVTTDRYQNKTYGFDDTTLQVIAEYPGDTEEIDTRGRDTVTADLVLLVPAEVECSADDEWTASDGNRYRAAGEPSRYVNPHSGTAVTQVRLRRIS